MTAPNLLAVLLFALIILVFLWDSAVIAMGNYEETVSSIIRSWSHEYPIFPFLVGMVVGHLLW